MEYGQSTSKFSEVLEPDTSLINNDLTPTKPDQRSFSGWDMVCLWIGIVVSVPAYYLAGSLVDLGMAWWQGVATIVVANTIVSFLLILNGHPGTKYGVSFPVFARSSFGVRGSHLPALLRALVGCCWYGIESWIGGQTVFLLLPSSTKQSSFAQLLPWLGTSPLEFTCFIAFWLVQLLIVLKGMDGIRKLEKCSAPVLLALTSWLLAWAYVKAGGFGHMLSLSSHLNSSEFWYLFFPSLTANIGFWATAINISDFTRHAKKQKDQIIGHAGLPIYMGAFTFVGVAVTSSTEVIFGRVISNPVQLLGEIGGLFTMILAISGITLAIITTNVACNVVAPANVLINLCPSKFNFRRGALLTAVLGLASQPWRLMQSSDSFVNTWLVGISALIGPIMGIILVDYYVLRGTNLDVNALYSSNPLGPYYYTGGYNLIAIAALVVGISPVIPGFLHKVGVLTSISNSLIFIYNIGWFVSFFSAGVLHWVVSYCFGGTPKNSQTTDPLLPIAS